MDSVSKPRSPRYLDKNNPCETSMSRKRLEKGHEMEASMGSRRYSSDRLNEMEGKEGSMRRRRLDGSNEFERSMGRRRYSLSKNDEMETSMRSRRRRYLSRSHACETTFRLGYDDNPSKFDTASPSDGVSAPLTLTEAISQPLQKRHRLEFLVIMIGATLLAFNAGFVNGSTMLLGGYPTAHVSGTVTKAGLDLANGDLQGAYVDCCITISFILGAAITGVMLKDDKFHLGIAYGPVFLLGSGLLLLACFANFFVPYSNLYFYLAAMACGLQNSMTTKYSGSIIRTTHMTGTATDIGLTCGKMFLKDYADSWKLLVLVPLLLGYLLGGIICVYAYRKLAHLTLVINFALFFSIGLIYCIVIGWQLNIPMWKAMLGMYTTVGTKVAKGKRKAVKLVRRVGGRLVRFKTNSAKNNEPSVSSSKPETEVTVQTMEVISDGYEYELVEDSNKFDSMV